MSIRRRKNRLSKGQWAVERDRFQLDRSQPVPTTENVSQIKDPLAKIVASLGIDLESTQQQLMENWDHIAGKALSRHIRPGPLENKALMIYCTNSVIMSELRRFQGKMLLKNIQNNVGEKDVKQLYFQIDPDTRGSHR